MPIIVMGAESSVLGVGSVSPVAGEAEGGVSEDVGVAEVVQEEPQEEPQEELQEVVQEEPLEEPLEVPQEKPVKGRKRARVQRGRFKADDPTTPSVNEAWQPENGKTEV